MAESGAEGRGKSKAPAKKSNAVKAWLIGYNATLSLSWLYILVVAVREWANNGTKNTYDVTVDVLKVAQTAAVLEVVHAYVGFVRSPWMLVLLQVFSRVGVFWGILWLLPQNRSAELELFRVPGYPPVAFGIASMYFCWSVTEIVRYAYYFLKECGSEPWPLLWFRYSGFVVLYPVGVFSELVCIYMGIPHARKKFRFSYPMPNALNFAADSEVVWNVLCGVIVVSYFFGLPTLYGHMLKGRKKALSGKSA